jgi:hypothetical protein
MNLWSCDPKALPVQYLEAGEVTQNILLHLPHTTLCATKIKSNTGSDIVKWHSDLKVLWSNLTVSKQFYL